MKKLILALVVAGSAPAWAAPDRVTEAAMDRLAAMPVVCSGKDDCDAKWAKALRWVLSTSGFKVQIATDTLIQTFGPSAVIHATAFSIIKVPTGGGNYTFEWEGTCQAQPFCGASIRDYRASFAAEVMGQRP